MLEALFQAHSLLQRESRAAGVALRQQGLGSLINERAPDRPCVVLDRAIKEERDQGCGNARQDKVESYAERGLLYELVPVSAVDPTQEDGVWAGRDAVSRLRRTHSSQEEVPPLDRFHQLLPDTLIEHVPLPWIRHHNALSRSWNACIIALEVSLPPATIQADGPELYACRTAVINDRSRAVRVGAALEASHTHCPLGIDPGLASKP
mmetsp:Transcript_77550/g.166254  ORF Transcript_77550/g.166254 Transcript_77550/m.166254 type:complete len:207 (-) Transcript_77550:571-1191(-)